VRKLIIWAVIGSLAYASAAYAAQKNLTIVVKSSSVCNGALIFNGCAHGIVGIP
jgi:hypothetical protein